MISSLIEWPHRSTCHHPSRHNRGEATGTWIPRQIEDIPSIISIQSASNSLIALNLFISNMDGTCRLFHQEGHGAFRDAADDAGITQTQIDRPVTCWFWDFDNDGWLD